MKILLSLLMFYGCWAQAQVVGGVKQSAVFRHMSYIHVPEKRPKLGAFGAYYRYKQSQIKKIRGRLNAKVEPLRIYLKTIAAQENTFLAEHDPSENFIIFNPTAAIQQSRFPINLRMRLPAAEGFRDDEVVSITLTRNPSAEEIKTFFDGLVTIFKTQYPQPKKAKKRFKNQKEKELYEVLRLHDYEFYQYEPYFAFYLGGTYLVDAEYLRDLNGVLNTRYIKVFRSFKTRYFDPSSEMRTLVNQEVIKDVQSIIEDNKFKNRSEPFKVDMSRIPDGIVRFEEKINELKLYLLVAISTDSKNPKIQKVIQNFLVKALK